MTVTPQQIMIVALFLSVMAGLGPAIHVFTFCHVKKLVDGPIKSGHDEEVAAASPGFIV